MDFAAGCSLAYTVNSPSALVFNPEAANLPRQVIRSETLATHLPIKPERFTAPERGNRFVRYGVSRGHFRLNDRAAVIPARSVSASIDGPAPAGPVTMAAVRLQAPE
jgi:hypothetical protein